MPGSKPGALPLGDGPIPSYRTILNYIHNNEYAGERFKPFTAWAVNSRGQLAEISRACRCVSNAANSALPEPVSFAREYRFSHWKARSICRCCRRAIGSNTLHVRCRVNSRIVIGVQSRVKSGCANILRVLRDTPGNTTTYQGSGKVTGSRSSPVPSTQLAAPRTNTGTSAPSCPAKCSSSFSSRRQCHMRLRASKVVAASELPPPKPAPKGIVFFILMVTPCLIAQDCRKSMAARTDKSSCCRIVSFEFSHCISPSERILKESWSQKSIN